MAVSGVKAALTRAVGLAGEGPRGQAEMPRGLVRDRLSLGKGRAVGVRSSPC